MRCVCWCADGSQDEATAPAGPSVEVAILAEGVSVNRAYLAAMEHGVLIPEEEPQQRQEHWQTFAWPHCKFELYSRCAPICPVPASSSTASLYGLQGWSLLHSAAKGMACSSLRKSPSSSSHGQTFAWSHCKFELYGRCVPPCWTFAV